MYSQARISASFSISEYDHRNQVLDSSSTGAMPRNNRLPVSHAGSMLGAAFVLPSEVAKEMKVLRACSPVQQIGRGVHSRVRTKCVKALTICREATGKKCLDDSRICRTNLAPPTRMAIIQVHDNELR